MYKFDNVGRPAEILLVEDNPADAELALIGLRQGGLINNVHLVQDGESALAFLQREGEYHGAPRPDLVLLDLNLPGIGGSDVLKYMKNSEDYRSIPVVVLTTSDANHDVSGAYTAHANAYMVKPVDFRQFHDLINGLKEYWFTLVCLPDAS